MVERVSNGPQPGGANLGEHVARRQARQNLVNSVSAPPPAAPDPDPIAEAPDSNEQIGSARRRRERLQAASPGVRKAAQTDPAATVRKLVSQAIRDSGENADASSDELITVSGGGYAWPLRKRSPEWRDRTE